MVNKVEEEEKIKVVFLDLDGVLNVEIFINAFWEFCRLMELRHPEQKVDFNEISRDDYGMLFCPTATKQLEWIIATTGAKIVISSTWRHNGLSQMQEMWKHRKLAGEVIDITPSFRHLRTDEEEKMDFDELAERGREIKHWLDKHPEVEQFVIFDDDNDMLPSQKNNFIRTDERYGITFQDSLKAVEILNGVI